MRVGAGVTAIAALSTLCASPASAFLQPSLSLPETLRGTVQVPTTGPAPEWPIDTLRDLYPALASCWTAPEGLKTFERTEITVRFSLRRDGSVIGVPRVTFSRTPADARGRALLVDATLAAVRRCTPVSVTAGLGGAIAGRPLALRFVYDGPRGRGV